MPGGSPPVILSLDPWRRAPILLWRRKPVAIVLAAAAAVLSTAAAAGPLFVSSASDATLSEQLTKQCQPVAGLEIHGYDVFGGTTTVADPLAAQMFDLHTAARPRIVGRLPHLAPEVRELWAKHVHVVPAGAPPAAAGRNVTLVAKTGSLRHVQPVGGGPTTGDPAAGEVWLADVVANDLHVRAGDTVDFPGGAAPVHLRVGGVFADLNRSATPPFWCNDDGLIHSYGNSPAFPFAIVDGPTAKRIAQGVGLELVDEGLWPIDRRGFTVEQAPALKARLDGIVNAVTLKAQDQRTRLLQAYVTAHPGYDVNGALEFHLEEDATTHAHLPLDRAGFVKDVLPSTITPITLAAVVVALILVGGSGSFWFERRRREVDVLLAHGVGPVALGVKAAIECAVPFLVGGVGGWFAGRVLVSWIGPSSLISVQSQRTAVAYSSVATVVGLLVLAAVATRRCAQRERASFAPRAVAVRRSGLVVAAGAAAVGLAALSAVGVRAQSSTGGAVARVDPIVLVAPLLAFVICSALVMRALVALLRGHRRRGDHLGSSSWLAWRRLTGVPSAAALLAAAVALPTAVGVYGAVVNASVRRTVHDQGRMRIGADLVVDLPGRAEVPAAIRHRATLVLRADHPPFGGMPISVLGVVPSEFAQDAFWDSGIPGPTMPSLVHKLRDAGAGAALDAVVAGPVPVDRTLETVDRDVEVRVVGHRDHLPGEQGGFSEIVVDRAALERVSTAGIWELWIRGDKDSALDAIAAAGLHPRYVYDPETVTDSSYLEPVTDTFSYLDALVTLIAAVAAGALLLYLDARSRARRLEYVLTRRMGLTRAHHLLSIALELAAAMAVGLLAGLVLAALATLSLSGRFNVEPRLPPGTVVSLPWGALLVDVAVLLGVLTLATVAAQRASERTPAAEVLREV